MGISSGGSHIGVINSDISLDSGAGTDFRGANGKSAVKLKTVPPDTGGSLLSNISIHGIVSAHIIDFTAIHAFRFKGNTRNSTTVHTLVVTILLQSVTNCSTGPFVHTGYFLSRANGPAIILGGHCKRGRRLRPLAISLARGLLRATCTRTRRGTKVA